MTVPTALAARAAVLRKVKESTLTQEKFFDKNADTLVACATALAGAFDGGARLLAFGNGGSACDAQHLAVELMHPVFQKRPPLPAIALSSDSALLTAVGNDSDFSLAFTHQLRLLARPCDIALGISTSGKSSNVLRALEAARELGLMRVGFTGRDGGKMAELCTWCFTVESFSIHRIQETHTVLLHTLWDLIHLMRGEEDVL
jgi:D-sedoheptulose 7-phosphate isomerase